MCSSDKAIWDAAYLEEINGLKDMPTWETKTEQKFQYIKSNVKALLPSMAISMIKKNELAVPNGPNIVVYHLVILILFTGIGMTRTHLSCQ